MGYTHAIFPFLGDQILWQESVKVYSEFVRAILRETALIWPKERRLDPNFREPGKIVIQREVP